MASGAEDCSYTAHIITDRQTDRKTDRQIDIFSFAL